MNTRVAFFGPAASGKTALIARKLGMGFISHHRETIGVDLQSIFLATEDKYLLWDLGGDPRFNALRPAYYVNASIGVYCIDLSKDWDEEAINKDLQQFKLHTRNDIPVFLVGTKADLLTSPEEKEKRTRQFNELQTKYFHKGFLTSACNDKDDGLDALWTSIVSLKSNERIKLLQEAIDPIPKDTQLYAALQQLASFVEQLPANRIITITEEINHLIAYLNDSQQDLEQGIFQFESKCKDVLQSSDLEQRTAAAVDYVVREARTIESSMQRSVGKIGAAIKLFSQSGKEQSSIYYSLIDLQKVIGHLPAEKAKVIANESLNLVLKLKAPEISDKLEAINHYVTQCNALLADSQDPASVLAAKVITAFAISAVLAFTAGFLIGLALTLWAGPLAFTAALAAGSMAAYAVVGETAIIGLGAAAVSYGLFKESRVSTAVNKLVECAEKDFPTLAAKG